MVTLHKFKQAPGTKKTRLNNNNDDSITGIPKYK